MVCTFKGKCITTMFSKFILGSRFKSKAAFLKQQSIVSDVRLEIVPTYDLLNYKLL